jgi:translation initiation factor 2 subunit 1
MAIDSFVAYSDPSVFDGLNVPEDVLAETKANIARRLTPQPVKIRADIELTCFSYAGIDAIKRALKAGEAVGTESIPIKVKLVAPPLFVMLSNATDKNGAIETMEKAITAIDKAIRKDKGSLNVKLRVSLVYWATLLTQLPLLTLFSSNTLSQKQYPRPTTWNSMLLWSV